MTYQGNEPVLGIDFGTSNSAAALIDANGQLNVIPLEGHTSAMPTALYFLQEDGRIEYGSVALATYLKASQEQVMGGRLMRSIKSLLGSQLMEEQTLVNGELLSFFDIVVLFFKELKARSEAHLGHRVQRAMLGRPVHFVDDNPQRDALAQATLARAAHAAGFETVAFQLEPIAAAFDFERRITKATTALVVDIGGGTSDFTVIQLGPDRQQLSDRSADVLATAGVHLGGTDFDRLLNLGCVMPSLGLGHVGPNGREVPNSIFFDLSTWHLIHHAYSRKSTHHAAELWRSYTHRQLHQRLMHVLQERQGHQLLTQIESAKIECSTTQSDANIDLDCIESALGTVLSPQVLQSLLAPPLSAIVRCAQDCVAQAGIAKVDVVYLTGGSSALTPVVAELQAAFPLSDMVQGDRFGGVAAGLAWAGQVTGRH